MGCEKRFFNLERIMKNKFEVKDRAGAERLVGRFAETTALRLIHEEALTAALLAARKSVEPDLQAIIETLAEQRAALEAWALSVKDAEFAAVKSTQMLHGVMGFNTGRPSLVPLARETWETVLAKLKGKWSVFVRTKTEVDRAALLKCATDKAKPIAPKDLSALGLKILQEDKFFIELKEL
jgi:phage host-nuclease inhibitor protein Gam